MFVIITIFVVTAVSNGANLNDGMDGMAAGNSAIIGLTLGILAYVSSHIEFAGYLNIMYIPGSEELVIFICAFIGARGHMFHVRKILCGAQHEQGACGRVHRYFIKQNTGK